MTSEAELPPGHRSRGRPALGGERIVSAALELVDDEGADALSMRALAQRLNSGTATLYRHFANRAQLVAQVVDRVFGEVVDDTERSGGTWQESCAAAARDMFATLGRHPGVAQLLLEQVPTGNNAMMLREKSLRAFQDNGFAPDVAVRAYATLSRYVLGFGIQLARRSVAELPEDELFRDIDLADFPATMAAAEHMPVSLQDEFEFGLGLLIDGLGRLR